MITGIEAAAGNFAERVPVATQDEVGQLAQAFNRMASSLEKIENLRRTLMIDVAHELRTPLTNIRGYLEALTDGVLPPSASEPSEAMLTRSSDPVVRSRTKMSVTALLSSGNRLLA